MSNQVASRPQLGEFISIICFKSMVAGMEEALGAKATAIALLAAGRLRGKNLVAELGLANASADLSTITQQLNRAVGSEGTCLTAVDKIVRSGDIIQVYCSETLCTAGEPQGSDRKCTFTMGAIWGALSEITGQKLRGIQTESVLHGGTHNVFEFTTIE